ncbi:aldehyde dehydrogenase-like protein [Hypoxylon sp. FL1284]|nr:aldehyde dehydrogenase-like protein [Hypoxylon sp. FL1284]
MGGSTYPGNVINGQLVPTAATRHTIDPALGEPLFEVPLAEKGDLDSAVRYARKAASEWSKTTHETRSELLRAFADAMEAEQDELVRLLTMETGKPTTQTQYEVQAAVQWLRGFSSMCLKDEVLDEDSERTIYSTRTPVGVCGLLMPWNWPLSLGMGKAGQALMTGNAIIVKPSPSAPCALLKAGELAMSIFPPGVFQVVSGDDDLGPWICEHPGIDMISITGSSANGKLVAASCAKTLKRYVLELGGNDAAIVCEDVQLDACVPKLTTMAFMSSGQVCMIPKRIYVHEKIYDEFRDAMVEFTKRNLKVGGGFEPDISIGPIQNHKQFMAVKDLYSDIDRSGLKTALAGQPREDTKGYFIEPSIIDNPPDNSRIVVEEPFGPTVPLLKWARDDEVIERANALRAGLGASVWTKDLTRANAFARELDVGSVWINSHFDVLPTIPFGGHKESGVGVEWGLEGFKQFTNHKTVWAWKNVFK